MLSGLESTFDRQWNPHVDQVTDLAKVSYKGGHIGDGGHLLHATGADGLVSSVIIVTGKEHIVIEHRRVRGTNAARWRTTSMSNLRGIVHQVMQAQVSHQLFFLPRLGVEQPPRSIDQAVPIKQIAGMTVGFGGKNGQWKFEEKKGELCNCAVKAVGADFVHLGDIHPSNAIAVSWPRSMVCRCKQDLSSVNMEVTSFGWRRPNSSR